MAKIESKDSHLRDILKDELYYQIPIYQRPYMDRRKLRKAFRRFVF
ncbi:hypothetical protein oki361_01880 [Helicobacter pylori]